MTIAQSLIFVGATMSGTFLAYSTIELKPFYRYLYISIGIASSGLIFLGGSLLT